MIWNKIFPLCVISIHFPCPRLILYEMSAAFSGSPVYTANQVDQVWHQQQRPSWRNRKAACYWQPGLTLKQFVPGSTFKRRPDKYIYK